MVGKRRRIGDLAGLRRFPRSRRVWALRAASIVRASSLSALSWGVLAWSAFSSGVFSCGAANAAEEARFGPIDLGGRFEYELLYDDEPYPYPWNAATHSVNNRSRLMLDLFVPSAGYGSLYLKGAAAWEAVGAEDVQKRFLFEQGDYLFAKTREGLDLSFRVFANERRFSVFDWTTPLISDDAGAANGENRGVRVDAAIARKVAVTALYSVLAGDFDDAPGVSYAKAQYTHRRAALSASYLIEDPGTSGVRNHAVVKTELAGAYKNLFAAASYAQSGYDESHVFFPEGSFDWGAYDGTNFSAVLPPGGAALAEVRLASLRATKRGELDLVWRYDAVREGFVGDLGGMGSSRVGQTLGAYFAARDVSLNARALYHTAVRSAVESEERDWFDAGLWAALKNGMECFVRGGAGEIDDGPMMNTRKNFVHAALRHRTKRVTAGVHAMGYDIDTEYAGTRYAWEGKVALNSVWGLHWRFILAHDYAASQAAFARLEFRPSERIYAAVGYGEPGIGDDPFVLEDRQIGLMRAGSSRYTILLRGDF